MDERRTTARKSDFISGAWSQKNENSKEISESFSNSTPKLLVKRVVKETNFYILIMNGSEIIQVKIFQIKTSITVSILFIIGSGKIWLIIFLIKTGLVFALTGAIGLIII